MKYSEILSSLNLSLAVRFKEKTVYQKKVAEALGSSLPTVRRRLNGQTPFNLEEMSIVCESLGIPVEEIFHNCSRRNSQPLEFLQYDFKGYESESNEAFDKTVEMLWFAAKSEQSNFYIICNTLPNILNADFGWLARFAALQWILFAHGSKALPSLTDVYFPPPTTRAVERIPFGNSRPEKVRMPGA